MTEEQEEAFLALNFRNSGLTTEAAWRIIFVTLWPETLEEDIPGPYCSKLFSIGKIKSKLKEIEARQTRNELLKPMSPDIGVSYGSNRPRPTFVALTSFQSSMVSSDLASPLASTAPTSMPESSDLHPTSTRPTSVAESSNPLIEGESSSLFSGAKDDDICSLGSDPDEIGSQSSTETTYEGRNGKALIGLFLAEDPSIRDACKEALSRMGKQRLTRTLRRLLKSFYKDILAEANSTTEKATARLLRSRPGRLRISGQIIDRIQQENEEQPISRES